MIVAWATFANVLAAESPLDKLEGQPVDISPWSYTWRADRTAQEPPEAYFIPMRLNRIETIYRKWFSNVITGPAPKGQLLTAALWKGGVDGGCVQLHWPSSDKEGDIPQPDTVETRTYSSKLGWFAMSDGTLLAKPEMSDNGHTWTYKTSGNDHNLEMVAVFAEGVQSTGGAAHVVPNINVLCPSVWKRMDVEIEWGFQPGTENKNFDGRVEPFLCQTGIISPLTGDKSTTVTGSCTWQSGGTNTSRRGIVVSFLYASNTVNGSLSGDKECPALGSRLTVWTKGGSFTLLVEDLQRGPLLVPECGMYVAEISNGKTARQFTDELAKKNLKTITQIAREHREVASWEELMREMNVVGAGEELPPLNTVDVPPMQMQVQVTDAYWTDAWRKSQRYLPVPRYEGLAIEAAYPIRVMNLVGLKDQSAQKLEYWLKAPGVKADGAFVDGEGSFEYAKTMTHDVAGSHDGCHPSTGRMLFAMAEYYFLNGDKVWFLQNQERMRLAADWIIRQRNLFLNDIPNRQDLKVAGLQPPQVLSDSSTGTSHWRWYLIHDAFAHEGLRRFADALADFDPAGAKKYHDEADAYGRDILRVVEREAVLSPVRLVRNGTYRTYIPVEVYSRGTMAGFYKLVDTVMGTLPLADTYGVLDPRDDRVTGHLEVVEESLPRGRDIRNILKLGLCPEESLPRGRYIRNLPTDGKQNPDPGKKKDVESDEDLFWGGYAELVKYSYVSKIHLLRDDIPCFLRHWMYNYAAYILKSGALPEYPPTGTFAHETNADIGDWSSTAWFMENFRNLLVMEIGDALWVARATPRGWLEQGKIISIKNAPTYFGALAYEIVSDVDNGKINATVEIPSRKAPGSVIVRFRHPKAAPIKRVEVNGKPWTAFNKDKETIELKGLTGTVAVMAQY